MKSYLSRGSFFPLLRIRSAALDPPPSLAVAVFASNSATNSSIASAFPLNSGDVVETSDGSTDAWYVL